MPTIPSLNRISSPWGWRVHPLTGVRTFHTGTDFSYLGLTGLQIRAPQSGRIMHDGTYGGYGEAIILEAGNTRHLFGHTAFVPDANVGDWVTEGQVIATIGSTGNSTGPHLHWEVRVDAVRKDPMVWLGQFAAPAAGSSPILIEDEMSAAAEEAIFQIRDVLGAKGGLNTETTRSVAFIVRDIQAALTRDLPAIKLAVDKINTIVSEKVQRVGTDGVPYLVSQLQELADIKTILLRLEPAVAQVKIDPAPVVAAVVAAIKATGVTVDAVKIAAAVELVLRDDFALVSKTTAAEISSRLSA